MTFMFVSVNGEVSVGFISGVVMSSGVWALWNVPACSRWCACLLYMELFIEHCVGVAYWFVWCCTHYILQIIRCCKILEGRLGKAHAICTWNWYSQILSQQNGSTVHSFCLSYLHTCGPYGTGEFYAEFSVRNVCHMVHKMFVVWSTKFTLSSSICIWILVSYSRTHSSSEYAFHY